MRRVLVSVLIVPGLLALAVACSVETTKYGPPESLRPVREPDGGYLIPRVDASNERVCPPGTTPDQGCAVQWKRDLYDPLVSGRWKCSTSECHGISLPYITRGDAKVARRELSQATLLGKPYIDTCSKDPAASAIVCNLRVAGTPATCGEPMPKIGTDPVTTADYEKLKQWLACGAPDN